MKRAQRWIVIGGCSYELAALTTGRTPTLTMLCRTRPWLRVALVGSLAVHLYRARGE